MPECTLKRHRRFLSASQPLLLCTLAYSEFHILCTADCQRSPFICHDTALFGEPQPVKIVSWIQILRCYGKACLWCLRDGSQFLWHALFCEGHTKREVGCTRFANSSCCQASCQKFCRDASGGREHVQKKIQDKVIKQHGSLHRPCEPVSSIEKQSWLRTMFLLPCIVIVSREWTAHSVGHGCSILNISCWTHCGHQLSPGDRHRGATRGPAFLGWAGHGSG